MISLQLDRPLAECPPVEQCALGAFVFDRQHAIAIKALHEVLGEATADRILQTPGRWLFLTVGKGGAGVMAVDSELDVIEAHRAFLQLPSSSGHIELFHYLAPELRARIIEDARQYALRVAKPEGSA